MRRAGRVWRGPSGRGAAALGAACGIALACLAGGAQAEPQPSPAAETLEQAICRVVDATAAAQDLPAPFLTRLIWQESSFRPGAVSRAGAEGVAQFMPGTARERGLLDPFDPEQAIPAAGSLLADLGRRFGNLGLAAAAYNGGPARVAGWLAGRGGLPDETRDYVARITGRSAQEWADDARTSTPPPAVATAGPPPGCLAVTTQIRRSGLFRSSLAEAAAAPWGVQLAGNFSKSVALASFERNRVRLASLLPDVQPMVIGTRLRSRGTRAFYRVRVPAGTRGEANALCGRIRRAGGSCAVLRS